MTALLVLLLYGKLYSKWRKKSIAMRNHLISEKGYMYVVFLVDHVALRFIIFYVWGKGNPVHTLS